MIEYYKVKGQLVVPWEWRLVGDFKCIPYRGRYYSLLYKSDAKDAGWYIQGHTGCGWDFATKFPDFDWIKEASLGHDILHWLIAKGVIPESQNDMIDEELVHIMAARYKHFPGMLWVRKKYIRFAINTMDQRQGEKRVTFVVGL